MTRHPGWASRLTGYLIAKKDTPFQWGSNDCALFAAGAIEAVTGQDVAVWVRGEYDSEEGSTEALLNLGYPSLKDYVNDLFETCEHEQLRRGDLIMSKAGELGVVVGAYAMAPAANGLTLIQPSSYANYWSVG